MSSYKDDFLHWDEDIDLDLILGDYTADESEKSSHTIENVVVYLCPLCKKEYKTISGFRGHTLKKHEKNFKASDHKQQKLSTDSASAKSKSKSICPQPKSEWISSTIYTEIFDESYIAAIEGIESNPIHNLPGKPAISKIATYCKTNEPAKQIIKTLFATLASVPVNIILSEDRENLFRKFHLLRYSPELQHFVGCLKNNGCPFPDKANHFVQIFILELINSLLKSLARKMKRSSTQEIKELTETDQKVLFYISGYIIHALKKKNMRIKNNTVRNSKLQAIENLTTDQKHETYLTKYSTLLDKKNRGGLKYPSENFFLLVRSMEIFVRKHTPTKLTFNSLSKGTLIENTMEDYMVKYYSEKVFLNQPESDSSDTEDQSKKFQTDFLEETTTLFVTIRGFAIVRVERNKLKSQEKVKQQTVCKRGDSFREVLKEKCLNVQTQ